jgi:hypothetical protein
MTKRTGEECARVVVENLLAARGTQLHRDGALHALGKRLDVQVKALGKVEASEGSTEIIEGALRWLEGAR